MALFDASYILLTKDLNLVVVLVYIFFFKITNVRGCLRVFCMMFLLLGSLRVVLLFCCLES